ncbi:MAG: hypothetical protein WD314_12685 [Trueperaceae bacterium]
MNQFLIAAGFFILGGIVGWLGHERFGEPTVVDVISELGGQLAAADVELSKERLESYVKNVFTASAAHDAVNSTASAFDAVDADCTSGFQAGDYVAELPAGLQLAYCSVNVRHTGDGLHDIAVDAISLQGDSYSLGLR